MMRSSQQTIMQTVVFGILFAALFTASSSGHAYSEYRDYIEKVSGRTVDCSMCHSHPEGPEGLKPGQIGSLTAEEQARLNKARTAFEPGVDVHSPILNGFGNAIIRNVGKQKFLAIRQHPEQLAPLLPKDSDLDGDGIPDARELLDGTHPLNAGQGNPWLLLLNNLAKNWMLVAATAVAAGLTLYGLASLRRFFAFQETTESDR